ncbi:hypothetical protein ACM64Y_14920 [Novispirillum sp. DQ9]|uniref:hypothetical protein n=1 Tax=Novispirillum sp. DQ9 TaxID=3398612 RepID=UPI003C7BF336
MADIEPLPETVEAFRAAFKAHADDQPMPTAQLQAAFAAEALRQGKGRDVADQATEDFIDWLTEDEPLPVDHADYTAEEWVLNLGK